MFYYRTVLASAVPKGQCVGSTALHVTFKGKTSLLMAKKEAMAFVQDASPATLPHTLLAVSRV